MRERSYRAEVEEEEDGRKDMLGMLMESEEELSEEHMVDFMLALLVAGYETTSTIMTLAIKFLTETPLALSQLKVSSPPLLLQSFLLPPFPTPTCSVRFYDEKQKKRRRGSSLLSAHDPTCFFTERVGTRIRRFHGRSF